MPQKPLASEGRQFGLTPSIPCDSGSFLNIAVMFVPVVFSKLCLYKHLCKYLLQVQINSILFRFLQNAKLKSQPGLQKLISLWLCSFIHNVQCIPSNLRDV